MKLGIMIILFFCIGSCFAQVPNIVIKKSNNDFYVDNQLIKNLSYEITNNDSSPVWIWFSKEDMNFLNDSLKVRRYFKMSHIKVDGSYYQWMCDGNVEAFTASLFNFWAKVLYPQESFYISFIHKEVDISVMMAIIDTHLNKVYEKEIVKQCPGIEEKTIKKGFTFNSSIISIPWECFRDNL